MVMQPVPPMDFVPLHVLWISTPVQLIKELRFEGHSRFANRMAGIIGSNMHMSTAGMRTSLNLVSGIHKLLGAGFMQSVSSWLHRCRAEHSLVEQVYARRSCMAESSPKSYLKVVYFPTCINRSMGKSTDYAREEKAVIAKTIQLLQKAGYEVVIPPGVNRLCCGMAFDSKGFVAEGRRRRRGTGSALFEVGKR